jgi:hypothetical protein
VDNEEQNLVDASDSNAFSSRDASNAKVVEILLKRLDVPGLAYPRTAMHEKRVIRAFPVQRSTTYGKRDSSGFP